MIILDLQSLLYTFFLSIYFLNKWLSHIDMSFILFFVILSSYKGVWFCVILLWNFIFCRLISAFIYV